MLISCRIAESHSQARLTQRHDKDCPPFGSNQNNQTQPNAESARHRPGGVIQQERSEKTTRQSNTTVPRPSLSATTGKGHTGAAHPHDPVRPTARRIRAP
jgi:hypothetical protein